MSGAVVCCGDGAALTDGRRSADLRRVLGRREPDNPCGGARVPGDELQRTHRLFALSGISGGAVGVATFALRLAEKSRTKTNDAWIDERLKRAVLSPTIAWALFVEAPQT